MQRRLENRNDDGLRHRDAIRMVGRKYPTTLNGRQSQVDLIEGTIENDQAPLMLRLMAASVHLKMEQFNMADEKMEFDMRAAERAGNERQPEVILVLPSNGSEIGAAAEDSGVESDEILDNEGEQNADELRQDNRDIH